jgi:hypothetical protein
MIFSDSGSTNYLAIANGYPLFSTYNSVGGQRSVQSSTRLVVGTTYHLVGTFDGVTMKLYVNAALVGSLVLTTAQQGTLQWGASKYIGQYQGNVYRWNGVIDEMAVYRQVLTPAEILDHYNTGRDIATY